MSDPIVRQAVLGDQNSTNVRPRIGIALRSARVGLRALATASETLAAAAAERLFFSAPRTGRPHVGLPAGAERVPLEGPWGGLAAWSWGQGRPVYLVHGWGGRSEQLAPFVRPLVDRGFRAVAFDAPAHGRSAGRLSSGPEFARALAAVAARCGRPHAVVAHSLGAAATVFACREGLRPGRLVFVGPAADPVAWARRFALTLGLSPRVQALLRARSERRIRASWDDLKVVPPTSSAPPLLVVHDRDDREVPWHDGAGIAAAWPGARLVTTTGLGHRRILKDPGTVDVVTAFVTGDVDADASSCGHERLPDTCEACVLEAELFAPAVRRELTAREGAARIGFRLLAPDPQ